MLEVLQESTTTIEASERTPGSVIDSIEKFYGKRLTVSDGLGVVIENRVLLEDQNIPITNNQSGYIPNDIYNIRGMLFEACDTFNGCGSKTRHVLLVLNGERSGETRMILNDNRVIAINNYLEKRTKNQSPYPYSGGGIPTYIESELIMSQVGSMFSNMCAQKL